MMHETTPCQAQVEFRDRVIGCFVGKLIGNLVGTEPHLLDSLSADGLRSLIGSTIFDCINLDLASLEAYRRNQGHLSSFDIAQAWLNERRYEDRSLDQVYENLEHGLFPPLSGTYRRRVINPAICWSRGHLWVFLGHGRSNWLDQTIRADAEIDCCRNGAVSLAPVLAAAQDRVLRGFPVELALHDIKDLPQFSEGAGAVNCVIEASKGDRDLHEAADVYFYNCKRKGAEDKGKKFGALLLFWMRCNGSMVQALSASHHFGLLDPTFGAVLGGLVGLTFGVSALERRIRETMLDATRSIAVSSNKTIDLDAFADEIISLMPHESKPSVYAVSELPSEYRSRKPTSQHKRFPYRVGISTAGIDFEFDYIHEPEFHICSSRMLSLSVKCKDLEKRQIRVRWLIGDGATISPALVETVLQPNTRRVFTVNCYAHKAVEWIEGSVDVSGESLQEFRIPFAMALAPTVRYDSLTRRPGATVSSDSETPSAPGCTQFVIDGQIGRADDERSDYWESSSNEEPHWLQINLPKPMRTNRILVHFADRSCHPVDFRAIVSDDGEAWTTISQEIGYVDKNVYEIGPFDLKIKHFRFEITRTSSSLTPYAAKISEVEMIPLGRGRNRVR